MADAPPFRSIRTIPNYAQQLAPCTYHTYEASIGPEAATQAFARTASGEYLYVTSLGWNGASATRLNAAVLNASMQIGSEQTYLVQGFINADVLPNSGIASGLVSLADINGDGILDIVIAVQTRVAPASTRIAVMLGHGGSSFGEPVLYGRLNYVTRMIVADVNGDGKLDVITISGTYDGPYVLFGAGNGVLQDPLRLRGAPDGAYAVAVGDVNRDGRPDVVSTTTENADISSQAGGTLYVALGTGDGSFTPPTKYPIRGYSSIAIGDLDSDGNPDIVTSGVTIHFGDGVGAFPARRDFEADDRNGIVLTDIDGDGKPDVVVATGNVDVIWGSWVTALLGRGSRQFAAAPVSLETFSVYGIRQLEMADVNGDGVPDAIVRDSSQIVVMLGDRAGGFHSVFHWSPGESRGQIAIADFNGDHIPDLGVAVVYDATPASNYVAILRGRGDGTFEAIAPLPATAVSLATGDFGKHGVSDLALLRSSADGTGPSEVTIWRGDGKGGFSKGDSYRVGNLGAQIAVADFNGDGVADMAIAALGSPPSYSDAEITLLVSRADGTFKTSSLTAAGAYGVATGDLNRDGIADLVIDGGGSGVGIALGHGDGSFGRVWSAAPAAKWNGSLTPGLRVVDLNGDGRPDVVSCYAYGGILLGNGDGTLQPPVLTPGCVPADMDGDGRTDLIAPAVLGVAPYFNRSAPPQAFMVVSSASMQPGPIAPGSFATAFGTDLAGASIATLRDNIAVVRPLRILYASSGQVNLLLPSDIAVGPATVAITNGSGTTQTAPVEIAALAPSIFVWDPTGSAAAATVTVMADGSQIYELADKPIDVQAGSQVYLVLYGTGFATAGKDVRVSVQGMAATVTYAGPQGSVAGLDQINTLLPRELAGTGTANIVVDVGTAYANTTRIMIR